MGIIELKNMREKLYQSIYKFTYHEDEFLTLRWKHASLDLSKIDGKSCPIASIRRKGKPSFYEKHVLEEDLQYYIFHPQINNRSEEVRRTSKNDVRIKYPHKNSKIKYWWFVCI